MTQSLHKQVTQGCGTPIVTVRSIPATRNVHLIPDYRRLSGVHTSKIYVHRSGARIGETE